MNKQRASRATAGMFLGVAVLMLSSCGGSDSGNDPTQGSGPAPSAVVLPMSRVAQNTQVWCWAATTSEVLTYFGFQNDQCQLVSLALAGDTVSCCPFPTPQGCLQGGSYVQIQQLIQYVSQGTLNATFIPSALSFDQITSEIDQKHPIIVFYSGSFEGHVVVLYGYDRASGEVYIHDPIFGAFVVPYGSSFVYAGQLVWAGSMTIAHF